MKNDISIKSLNCPNCGAQLSVGKNATDVVFCSACGTRCVVTGLNVNAELLKKNDINSGIPLVGTPDIIHEKIFKFITGANDFPIDILQNLEIIAEQKIVVPAYLYTVSAFASYTYEAGNERQQDKVVTNRNGQVVTKHISYTEWTQMSAIANDTRTVIVCGNKAYMDIINAFYQFVNPDVLVDIEYLDYPDEAKTESFNVPYASAFNTYVKPAVEQCVSNNAVNDLTGKKYRNLKIGKANIQKEYEARVSLGIYEVDCRYKDQYFTMYFNSDASALIATVDCPRDTERAKYINRLKYEMNSIKSTGIKDLFHGGFSYAKENSAKQKDQKAFLQSKIKTIAAEAGKAKAEFQKDNCRFKGIYSNGKDGYIWQTSNPDVPMTKHPFVNNQYYNQTLQARYDKYEATMPSSYDEEQELFKKPAFSNVELESSGFDEDPVEAFIPAASPVSSYESQWDNSQAEHKTAFVPYKDDEFESAFEGSPVPRDNVRTVVDSTSVSTKSSGAKEAISTVGVVIGWVISSIMFFVFLLFFFSSFFPADSSSRALSIVTSVIMLLQIILINPLLIKLMPDNEFFSWTKKHRISLVVVLIVVWVVAIVICSAIFSK